jgi:outer membrane protein assembly factor BamB
MHRNTKAWMKVAALAALVLGALVASAQDWPTYGGDNQRSGHNAFPASASGPGRSFLRWWRPNANDNPGQAVVVDNTTVGANVSTGLWQAPATVLEEANNPFLPDLNTVPAYAYAFTTASLDSNNPEVPQIAGQHRTWTWTLAPTDGIARNYGLYVWLPIGPTVVGGLDTFQQRFFVYEILYGAGGTQREIQIVDTFQGGTGMVRLGNGGAATNKVYQYDGINPIQIRLHNTVPHNADNSLSDTPGTTLVYADAASAVPAEGEYVASPIVAQFSGGALTHVVAAKNRSIPITDSLGNTRIVVKGVVSSHLFDTGATRWTFTPDEVNFTTTVDNDAAAVTADPIWLPPVTTITNRVGPDYLDADVDLNIATAGGVTYAPTLQDGDYEVYAWIPGTTGLEQFGQAIRYQILEGLVQTDVDVNQDVFGGWVRIGATTFRHDSALGNDLRVRVTNFSPLATDFGRKAYADAIRFVRISPQNLAVNSTPLHATAAVRLSPAGTPTDTEVVIVAAENGRIYCLDANGSGSFTTAYWSYPSTPDPNNPGWTDPNAVAGEDGAGPTAEMPTGFDLSSAIVQRIGTEDFLFVGSTNGRVYCIEMAGRGDRDTVTGLPGTTRRVWTFPNDYPANTVPSNLGPIAGSVSYAVTASGPTLFVPASQGRIYALDAVGNPGNKTTTIRWQFPAANAQPPGRIVGTPAIAFGNIYFGTQVGIGNRGWFYALNLDTGAIVWSFSQLAAWSANPDFQLADSFNSGPVTIPSAEMVGMPDTVVVANDNRWITAFNAATGAPLWTTDELGGMVIGNLSFTHQMAFNNAGVLQMAPVVLVPVADGRIMSLFAETARTNIFGGNNRLAWGFETDSGGMTSQIAVGRNWMYAADDLGFLYAFSDSPGVVSPGTPPGRQTVVPNDPAGLPFREARIKFVNKATYDALRQVTGTANHLSYAQATQAAREITRVGFEWGETVYALVYNLPYSISSNPVPPGLSPQVNYRFNVEGASVRNVTVSTKQFSNPGTAPASPVTGERLDGYAITSFTIQGSGSTALPPGNAQATFTVNAQFSPGARLQSVALDPTTSRRPFAIANPLAIAVRFDNAGFPLPNYHIGYTPNPDDPEAAVNGSPDVTGTPKNESLLLANVGMVAHGQQGSTLISFIDRSLMTLLRGPGRGLDQVRVSRSDLAWQGGSAAIYKPINLTKYPLIEDRPDNFPNNSLDYPDIGRENISIIKDRFGNVENPVYGGVSLNPPTGVDPNNILARTLIQTPVNIDVSVPRFQPPNSTGVVDSAGVRTSAGYYGRLEAFVDSSGNGQLDRRGRREAFRSFWLGSSVAVDERFVVETPVVDLGSLTQGAGYSPLSPGTAFGDDFNPWTGMFASFYKKFTVRNIGNTNLLNLRMAKATNGPSGRVSWGLFAPANHERSWLDTDYSLWSDIDETYAWNINGVGPNSVLLQKARPGDVSGTTLSTNPRVRPNPFLNVGSQLADPSGPPAADPRVAVSIPIGTPVGTYVTAIRVVEDTNIADQALQIDANGNPLEPYSDPGFTLRFNVREGRVTNSFTPGAAPMITHSATGSDNFLHKNVQPTAFRDLAGQLIVAYASNEAAFNTPQPPNASLFDSYRIFIASMNGDVPGAGAAQNPLRDLLIWNPPGTGRWFRHAAGPLPTVSDDVIFGSVAPEFVLPNTSKYGAPAFPALGRIHPLTGAQANGSYVAFLAQAEKQTPNGRVTENRIVMQRVVPDAAGNLTIEGPWVMGFDPTTGKGRPAIVQSDERATVFFAGSGTGSNTMFYSHFDGASFAQPQPLPLGSGFEEFGTPSVSARRYLGQSVPGLPNGTPVLELTFSAKLRGRAHSEVYFARLHSDGRLTPTNAPGTRTPLVLLPRRVQERLVAESELGTYTAAGQVWEANDPAGNPIVVEQLLGGTVTNLEVPNTRTVDRSTGLISFETRLGGRAYLDPAMGSVRFAGTLPARSATILLSYAPRILRISMSGGAAYAGPSGIFDPRFIGDAGYWATRLNTAASINDPVQNDRYIFTYGRAAAGAGSASRPYMRTVRFGVQLPTAVHTQSNGNLTNFSVANMANTATSFYQVDPANGRVYFTAENENFNVTITYTGVDEAGNTVGPFVLERTVTLIGERAEAPVPIEQAVNESQLFSFIDPLDSPTDGPNNNNRRPGLIWMVYTSTRAGSPDIYFQTIAPRFTPVRSNRG